MDTHPHNGTAERAGRLLGRVWRAFVRNELKLAAWLTKNGLPVPIASTSIWVIRLTLLALVLEFSITLAGLIVVLLVVAVVASRADYSVADDQPQMRDGLLGFGLYDRDGFRIDPHDPDRPN